MSPQKLGRIYTFYSYKGGTGRTMAMANIAWILASAGRRVLTIDWDLEAPGLHRYYHPFLRDPEATAGEGLIEFLLEFVGAAHQEWEGDDQKWFAPYANILPYAVPVDWDFGLKGALHMVSAGRQDGGYATRVTAFDWVSFYKQLGGGVFLQAVKQRLREEYDYILIDSRTGLSDTSGICSVQMPDDLVCCFTLNSQSINGASGVAESAFSQRIKPNGEPGLRVWPVATRVELSEREKLENARDTARLKFSKFISHIPRNQRLSYLPSVEVLYQPYFAYEEILATVADRRHQTGSLLGSFESITRWITSGDVSGLPEGTTSPEGEIKRREAVDKFVRHAAVKPKVYVAIELNENMLNLLPDWYLGGFAALSKMLPAAMTGGLSEWKHFVAQLGRTFGPDNVLVKQSAITFAHRAMEVPVSPGTTAEADVVLFPVGHDFPEVTAAMKSGTPVFGFRLPSAQSDSSSASSRAQWFPIDKDDFEGSFLELQTAIELAARSPRSKRLIADPEDPQKGRWGESPIDAEKKRALSAEVTPVSNDWFNVALQVKGPNLKGDVVFYLHPSFQPNTLTVPAQDGVAKVEVQAYGAFTVGAAADHGATVLELDLAQNSAYPQTFRER